MKKIEIYRLAQISVVSDSTLPAQVKLDIIRELQHQEYFAKLIDEKAEVEKENCDERS